MTASCGFMWLGQRCTLEAGHEELRHVEERDGRRIASCPPLDFAGVSRGGVAVGVGLDAGSPVRGVASSGEISVRVLEGTDGRCGPLSPPPRRPG